MIKAPIIICIIMAFCALSFIQAAGENITFSYPASVISGQVFQVNVTLVNFSEEVYDVKVDIKNSSDSSDRLSEMYNGSSWRSTNYYFYNATNTSVSNSTVFSLNITRNYNGTGNITVTIRKSSTTYTFEGYSVAINASQAQTCTPSFSCSNSSCSASSQTLTQTCTNTTSNCSSIITTQALSCSNSSNSSASGVNLALEWNDADIINGTEFNIDVKAYNLLDYSYDVKVWMTFYENDTVISDRYDANLSEWKSGTYYLEDFFANSGNRTKSIKLRLRSDFIDFTGDAKIHARIRYRDEILKEITNIIEVLKSNITSSENTDLASENLLSASSSASPDSNSGVIDLRTKKSPSKAENSIIYKSKNAYIREYTPYVFGGACILLVIFLLFEKGKTAVV